MFIKRGDNQPIMNIIDSVQMDKKKSKKALDKVIEETKEASETIENKKAE